MKKILTLVLILAITLSLFACQTVEDPDNSTESTASSDIPSQTTPSEATDPTDATVGTEPSTPSEPTDNSEPTTPTACRHEYSKQETTATCTQPGLIIYTCPLCGDVAMEETPPEGHNFADASCLKAKVCKVCGITDGAALGHHYVDGKCSRCGAKIPGEDLPPSCVHEWSIQQTAPTCTQSGKIIYTCTKCGYPYTETIPANGHRYTEATCKNPKTCSVCKDTVGNALGHDYRDGKCHRCGTADPDAPTTVDFKVTVRSDKGNTLEGITVQIYTDGTTPIATGKTNSKGVFTVTLDPHSTYDITLSDVPKQYSAKERYTFSYHIVNINLTTIPIISPTDHSQANYKVGSTMGDFTLTDTDGISYTLSELLKEKELVLLDFWFVNCAPCKSEFPYFESVCKKYGDRIQLLTLDPLDSEDSIKQLRQELGFTFPMIKENIGLHTGFKVKAYPTMVFIDRSGKILKIETGAYKSEQQLIDDIERFLS